MRELQASFRIVVSECRPAHAYAMFIAIGRIAKRKCVARFQCNRPFQKLERGRILFGPIQIELLHRLQIEVIRCFSGRSRRERFISAC